MDDDYALALQLQADIFEESQTTSYREKDNSVICRNGLEPQSLVDPYWETTDPNPDVRALFLQFNERFFWGMLAGIEVRWSPRMTLCAGLCCYEGRGGLCSVRLSVPLLKLRPRKDLIETLLHEMIHAYLFVTDNNKDHDGHGPEFHKHMYRINKEAGTNISVYHNFHDEVDSYRQHWWRCDGPCRERKPYYGYVKRSMNRAPSKNDTWWTEHQRTCGGSYTKIKEPENYGKKKGKKDKDGEDEKKKEKGKSSVKSMDIRVFGGEGKTLGNTRPGQSINTKFDNLNVIPKPSGSVFKQINSTGNPKPTATVSRLEDSSASICSENSSRPKPFVNGHVTHLPGARTPDKKGISKNKPVSQGGVGKFNNKKRSFDLPNFSDSDDTDDDLLRSVPLENLSNTSIHSDNRDKRKTSQAEESWWDSDSNVNIASTTEDKNKSDAEHFLDESKKDTVEFGVDSGTDENRLNHDQSLNTESDVNDVRAMLRKVWGQKQFGNKHTKIKVTGTLKSGSFQAEVSKNSTTRTKNKEIVSTHKRLSEDAGFDIAQVSKRKKSGSGISIYTPKKDICTDTEKRVDSLESSKQNKLTSPIDKFFKKVGGTSNSPCETPVTNFNQSSVIMGENSDTCDVRGENPITSDIRTVSAAEMNACPVCNKSVLTTEINEHLDLCLTMQAI